MVRRLIVWKFVYYCFCMRSIFWLKRPTSPDHIVDRQSTTGTEWMDSNWTRIVQVNVWATDSARGCELRNKFSLTLCQNPVMFAVCFFVLFASSVRLSLITDGKIQNCFLSTLFSVVLAATCPLFWHSSRVNRFSVCSDLKLHLRITMADNLDPFSHIYTCTYIHTQQIKGGKGNREAKRNF